MIDGTRTSFDVEIWHETDTFVLVSPRTRTFVINPKYGDRITIDTIAYVSKCATSGSSGTRPHGHRRDQMADAKSAALEKIHAARNGHLEVVKSYT